MRREALVGLISDTRGLLPPRAVEAPAGRGVIPERLAPRRPHTGRGDTGFSAR